MRRRTSSLCGSKKDVQQTSSSNDEETTNLSRSTSAVPELQRSHSYVKTIRCKSSKIFRKRSAFYQQGSIGASLIKHVSQLAFEDNKKVKGQNNLHTACLTHPQMFIVEEIIRDCPSCVAELDSMGQSPLHVAATRGASPDVVRYILEKNPAVASLQDAKGKTPLILSCEHCCQERACDTGNKDRDIVKGPLVSVIKALCERAPLSVNVEDKSGNNALRYALERGAGPKVLKILHKASQVGWENLKHVNSEERIFDLGREELLGTNKQPTNSLSPISRVAVAKVA